ncbi:hypothetical protein Bbelb_429920 [Branchiostoma belcheri]|nr:hypothetical protein Bbelb_429920 [Branchiostoma belcheri]
MSTFRRKAPYRKMWVGVKVAFRLSERDPGFVSAEVAGGDGSGCLSGEDTALSAYSAGPELRDLDAWGETDGLRVTADLYISRTMVGSLAPVTHRQPRVPDLPQTMVGSLAPVTHRQPRVPDLPQTMVGSLAPVTHRQPRVPDLPQTMTTTGSRPPQTMVGSLAPVTHRQPRVPDLPQTMTTTGSRPSPDHGWEFSPSVTHRQPRVPDLPQTMVGSLAPRSHIDNHGFPTFAGKVVNRLLPTRRRPWLRIVVGSTVGAAGAEKVITGRMWNDVTRGVKITRPGPRW